MSPLEYGPDRKITEVLQELSFTLSAEIVPPRNGTEFTKVMTQIRALAEAGVNFFSVTKGAGGSLRGGSLPIAQAIKEHLRLPCIAHFTCRDITPQDVENQLMDHHYFGIRNILALRGDPPHGQPEWQSREGSHDYAFHLIEQIHNLNQGTFLPRPGGRTVEQREATDFCIGAAAYAEHPDEKERLEFFRHKVEAGAEFGITQIIFNAEHYGQFLDLLEKNGITVPVLPGTRILRTKETARRMCKMFNVKIPDAMFEKLPDEKTEESAEQVVDEFVAFTERLREYGAPGIHLFVLSETKIPVQFLTRLSSSL